jgi:hypothetical protein
MPKKASKLALLADQIAVARRIIEGQQTLLEKLRIKGEPTREAEGALRTYVSSLSTFWHTKTKLRTRPRPKKARRERKKQNPNRDTDRLVGVLPLGSRNEVARVMNGRREA